MYLSQDDSMHQTIAHVILPKTGKVNTPMDKLAQTSLAKIEAIGENVSSRLT